MSDEARLLRGKVAVIHGAGGAIGGAVAQAFAKAGAQVFLSGRKLSSVQACADQITAAGGFAEAAQVDALDEAAIDRHLDDVVARAGRVDIAFNAIGVDAQQGTLLADLPLEAFTLPVATLTTSQFLTARAASRHMAAQGSGVILTLSASPARLAVGMTGGLCVAWSAVEALSRTLAAELGPHGVRVVCIRSHRIVDTMAEADFPMEREAFVGMLNDMTLLKRTPTRADVANTAVFLASDHAAAMTGTVANLTCGMSVD
ncbi:SDR family oxidoreductase [Phenylobacterium sp.]|uniref:SDR family NAD(P)-dependent oxidoreductase n=1 Tax=Phenylobacterium sp. TaxID=1871053 RepID=UPI00286B609B|nr:SDR family oxidoreductase [Phenylobacterium sp.]